MKHTVLILLQVFGIVLYQYSHAQQQTPPAIEWQKSLGGSKRDDANSVHQTQDGGYIIAGFSNSSNIDVTGNHGDIDSWIVKLNGSGDIEWQKSLGGSSWDGARSIQQTKDGGYIVAGESNSKDGDLTGNHGEYDYWIVKINDTGAIQWQKSIGGDGNDFANSIKETQDGGYIVAGRTGSSDSNVIGNHGNDDYWVLKLNDTGLVEWQKSLGGSVGDYAQSIQQTSDGGYIVAGFSNSTDGDVTGHHDTIYTSDAWIVKLNDTGSIQWQKSLGGSNTDYANSIEQTLDGGFIVAGGSSSIDGDLTENNGYIDYWIVKLNDTGAIQWQSSLGGSTYDHGFSIQQTQDGGYIVAGVSHSLDNDVTGGHGNSDYWVVKLNGTGTIQWQKSLGGSNADHADCIQQTSDGGFIVGGYSYSNDGDITGHHGSSDTADYWIVKLATEKPNTVPVSKQVDGDITHITPNPASGHISLNIDANLTLFSLTGQRILSYDAHSGERIELPELASGVYIAKIVYGGVTRMEKLLIR